MFFSKIFNIMLLYPNMIKLDKIYTTGGDKGKTSLGTGKRVKKTDTIIIAIGSVEELNAHIGVAISTPRVKFTKILKNIQNDLFDIGADLAFPNTLNNRKRVLRITKKQVSQIEKYIDSINIELPPLTSFILPGGSLISSRLHLARTVCRRCEINILQINKNMPVNLELKKYINRLSDLLFVIARAENIVNNKEVLWKPGKNI